MKASDSGAAPLPLLLALAKGLPSAAFLTLYHNIDAASFGLLIVPAAADLPISSGIPIYLLSVVAGQVGFLLASRFSSACGGATIELVPLLAPLASCVGIDQSGLSSRTARASTLLALLSCTSLLIAIAYFVIARFKLGRLLRCIPLIVLKAALTGVGVYMVVEAIKMGVAWKEEGGMSEGETTVFLTETARAGSQLFGPPARPLLLATLLTLAGYIIVKKLGFSQSQSLGYLAAVAIAINALTLGGVCCSAAPGVRDPGWYFGGDEEGEAQASALGLLAEFRPSEVSLPVLATALPYMLSCVAMHAIVAVTDMVSLEAIASSSGDGPAVTLDLNHEIGATAVANLLAAAVGAMPNYLQLTPSLICFRLAGSSGSRAGPLIAVFTAASLWAVSPIVSVLPRCVVAAFMLEMGIDFVLETGIRTFTVTTDPVDQVLIIIVPTVMLLGGFLPGIRIGLLVALANFVVKYSAAPIVRFQQTGGVLRSNTVRPREHQLVLDERASHSISIISLQGFVMFGSAPQLSDALDNCLARRARCPAQHLHTPPWFVIVDARAVKGCDFGALQDLEKMRKAVVAEGGIFRVAQPPPPVAHAIERALEGSMGELASFNATLHMAEDAVIAAHAAPMTQAHRESLGATAARAFLRSTNPEARKRDLEANSTPPTAGGPGLDTTRVGNHEAVLNVLTSHTPQVESTHVAHAEALLSLGKTRAVAAGEQLWGVTDQPSFWVVVLEGQLETRRHGYTIEELVAGSACGFLFLLVKGRQRETDLVAVQASRALLVTAEAMGTIESAHPALYKTLVDAFVAKAAAEYRHWIRHTSVLEARTADADVSQAANVEVDRRCSY